MRLKPFIQRVDGLAKSDLDVRIMLDIIVYAEKIDIIALVPSDGDIDLLAKNVKIKH